MSKQIERQARIRAEMVCLLLESNTHALHRNQRPNISEDLRAYAILLMIASSSFFIWFTGEPSNAAGLVASLVGLLIASSLTLLEKFQLSVWVVAAEDYAASVISWVKTRVLKC